MGSKDWVEWHRGYDDPGSGLTWRLATVRSRIREALDGLPLGPIRVVSLCAGDGRDLLGVLDGHPRAAEVAALLVEQHPDLAARARDAAARTGTGVRVVTGDASLPEVWAGAGPVDLLLLCGIFGNVPDDDVAGTIAALPGFCRPGSRVIWTRHRRPPDLTPSIRRWFAQAGFAELSFDASPDHDAGVGGNRYAGTTRVAPEGRRLFRFR